MRKAVRRARAALAGAFALVAAAAACNGGNGFVGPAPVVYLPSSPASSAAFDAIRTAWAESVRTPAASLRSMLERFIERFPRDAAVPVVRITLALVALQQGDFAAAEQQIHMTAALPAGPAHDLWTIARAEWLRLHGRPDEAFSLLRPFAGKSVDPFARSIFEEELTLAALATGRDDEAVSDMDAWLRALPEEDKPSAVARVREIVAKLPRDVLVRALPAMRERRSAKAYGVEMTRVLFERLVEIATESGDAQLARTLLDADADAISDNAARALGELANSRRGLNLVDGRTVGLLLPTDSPDLRDESADVLRGVMWALGLPRGARAPQAKEESDLQDGAGACAPPEPAPNAGEPSPGERVRLVTRDDAGSSARTEVSLDELAGEGASVLIAGLDAKTAARALRWGEKHELTVIALVPPDEPLDGRSYGFVLGEPRTTVVGVLTRAAPALGRQSVTPVVDASELASFPEQGGPFEGLTLTAPVSCDVAAPKAGDPRFPIPRPSDALAWLVSGAPACAEDLVAELSAARARGLIALTLEAAALPAHGPGLRVVTAGAGIVPSVVPGDPRRDEALRFASALGQIGWWTALGRDASTLARLAVRSLPADVVSDLRSIRTRRATARDALAATHVRLWTTEASAWGNDRTMPRTVCALEVPAH